MNAAADSPPLDPGDAFAELARIVLSETSLESVLDVVVTLAKRVFPEPIEVSVTLLADDDASTAAFTGEVALAMDERQYDAGSGPCLDAASAGEIIMVPDVAAEDRWPAYTKAAQAAGVGSSLSVTLPVQRQLTGALNFYSAKADGFDDDAVELAKTFAGYAAVAIANTRLYESTAALADQMRQAMESRAVIEQAKGIIMRDERCSPSEAFDSLVRMSQRSHHKLREVAQLLVDEVSGSHDDGDG